MARWTVFAVLPIVAGLLNAPHGQAQSAPASSAFEVASVKLNKNCDSGGGVPSPSITPGRLNFPCFPLRALIRIAYGDVFVGATLNSRRMEALGGPGWLDTDRYSLSAKAEGKASTQGRTTKAVPTPSAVFSTARGVVSLSSVVAALELVRFVVVTTGFRVSFGNDGCYAQDAAGRQIQGESPQGIQGDPRLHTDGGEK